MTVMVNGKRIDADAIHREMQYHPASSLAAAREAAARALVVRELILEAAQRGGVTAKPEASESPEEALIRQVLEREVAPIEPDEESCQRYFEKNRAALHTPLIHVVSHILLMVPEEALARQEADERARELLRELSGDVNRFREAARKHSDCPSGRDGGRLGRVDARNTTPEFVRALARLEPGRIAPAPVETRYGFHIVYVEAREGGVPYSYPQARPLIVAYLRDTAHRRALVDYVRGLVAQASIEGVEWVDNDRSVIP